MGGGSTWLGPPRRLSARAALAVAAFTPKPATARTTSKAERTPPHTQHLGAWVRLPIDLFEALDAGVRVDLRGADTGVTEQFLHRAQVGTAIHHVGGEGMTQRVRAESCSFVHGRQQLHDGVLNRARAWWRCLCASRAGRRA